MIRIYSIRQPNEACTSRRGFYFSVIFHPFSSGKQPLIFFRLGQNCGDSIYSNRMSKLQQSIGFISPKIDCRSKR